MTRRIFALCAVLVVVLTCSIAHANFLEQEAGITAYFNAGKSINLNLIKPVYRVIEHDTPDYVVGSVQIGEYAENEDVHVYVHRDGWIAAYYLADEPTSKIIDWRNYQGGELTSTKLLLALNKVASGIAPVVDVKYYHFVTPQANRLSVFIDQETTSTTDTFDILIPDDIIIYERSWGLYNNVTGAAYLDIDDEQIKLLGPSGAGGTNWNHDYGKLTPDQLTQSVFHTVEVKNSESYGYTGWAAGGVCLVYQQP